MVVIAAFLAAAACAATAVQAKEDVLFSKRAALNKRFLDSDGNYNISFYHINDVHAHLDQYSSSGTDCTDETKGCYGGYARVKTVLNETRPQHQDSLFLDVGDEFQGTFFFSYYGGEKIADTLNQMGIDGMTLGNHEFDRGDEYLAEFLSNLTFPIISANVESENEVLSSILEPYHIYEEYQLAVIGVTTETTPTTSSPDKTTNFTDPIEAVQNTIDHILSTTNITRIAAITHIGYDRDQTLAESTTGLYLIMGGHSHTPLGDFEDAEGPYPTIVQNKDGEDVFIVTAYRWGEYLGYIDVTYDEEGKILAYHGGPIHLDNATKQDADYEAQVTAWRGPFEAFASQVLGYSDVELDQTVCQKQECLLGDFMADAMLWYRENATEDVAFAFVNAGGIRATIDAGNITRGEVLTSFPFGNAVVSLQLTGQRIWDIMEGLVSGFNVNNGEEVTSFFQISSGVVVLYDPTAANGSVLTNFTIDGAPLDLEANYNVITVDFIATGGDNIIDPEIEDVITLDTLDEVLINYIAAQSPINITLDGRITSALSGATGDDTSTGSTTDSSTNGSTSTTSSTDAASGAASFGSVLLLTLTVAVSSVFFM